MKKEECQAQPQDQLNLMIGGCWHVASREWGEFTEHPASELPVG